MKISLFRVRLHQDVIRYLDLGLRFFISSRLAKFSTILSCYNHVEPSIVNYCLVQESVLYQIRLKDWHFWQKWPFSDKKKWHFEWPNQNSKTTFIVQTFPKYGPYDFYLVNLSLLGAILAIFQFCGFSGLFWPFFPCK